MSIFQNIDKIPILYKSPSRTQFKNIKKDLDSPRGSWQLRLMVRQDPERRRTVAARKEEDADLVGGEANDARDRPRAATGAGTRARTKGSKSAIRSASAGDC